MPNFSLQHRLFVQLDVNGRMLFSIALHCLPVESAGLHQFSMLCSAVQCSGGFDVGCCANVQYSAVQCSEMQCNIAHCAVCSGGLEHGAGRDKTGADFQLKHPPPFTFK